MHNSVGRIKCVSLLLIYNLLNSVSKWDINLIYGNLLLLFLLLQHNLFIFYITLSIGLFALFIFYTNIRLVQDVHYLKDCLIYLLCNIYYKGSFISTNRLSWGETNRIPIIYKFLYIDPIINIMNLGPTHPSTHGVLRICCFVQGENIKWIEPEIGLLHRGTEKLIELRNWNQSINYFNRLDYVSLVAQEEIYCYTIEKCLNLRISHLSSLIRVIFLEISRIFNHLLAVVTHAIDVGAFSPFLFGFEEREKLIEF
jgi:hypothetical protein